MRVVLQPCGDSASNKHYVDTIENPVSVDRIASHLSAHDRRRLNGLGLTRIPVWGVTPGKRSAGLHGWMKLRPGDTCLLYRQKKIFAQAKIIMTFRCKPLALDLWTTDRAGNTWECIYLLDDLRAVNVGIAELNKAVGYKENNYIQGFTVLSGEKAEAVAELLEIDSTDLIELDGPLSESDAAAALRKIGTDTDIPTAARARAEAGVLRKFLFGGARVSDCQICGRRLPTTLLVTAHIKKRASCSADERVNLRVVMRACRFGCDELYEKGFIYVDAQGVVRSQDSVLGRSADLDKQLRELDGGTCSAHDSESAIFFTWHRSHAPRRFL